MSASRVRRSRLVPAVAVVLAAALGVPASAGVHAGGSGTAVSGRPAEGRTAWRSGQARGVPDGAAALGGHGRLEVGPTAAWSGVAGSGASGVAGSGVAGRVAGPRVLAKAAILADEATGQVLFERSVRVPRAMASTTKVMTALLTLERLDERRVVVIGAGPPRVGEESLRLRRGERLTVRQLLLGLLVKSANDAAVALAEAVDGSEAAFVRRMNRKAAFLRLGSTRYVTPYGLDRPGHRTSARDLARLWEVAMRRPDFRSLVATKAARLPGVPLSLRRFVASNQLLGSYRWTVGGKTGYTSQAGRCLVASASRGGRRLVAVALGSPNAFADVQALFEYGFSRFVWVRLAGRGQPVSVASGRPATLQVAADVDALVRLDQLDQIRLSLGQRPAGAGSGSAGGGQGSAGAGGPGADGSAWFMSGRGRLVRVLLVRAAAIGGPPTVPSPPATEATSGGPAGSSGSAAGTGPAPGAPGSGAGPAPGAVGPVGATLTAGAAVRVWPVPPGAAGPVIDPFLRRDPP
jgi:serine-type D-Ala-D-Ala carboxypeptidase (penicillin-binding protein 5/6)